MHFSFVIFLTWKWFSCLLTINEAISLLLSMISYKLVLLMLWDAKQLRVPTPTSLDSRNGMHKQGREVILNDHTHLQYVAFSLH